MVRVRARTGIRGMGPGGYGGGVIPVPSQLLRGAVPTAKRAPEAPARGLEWVVGRAGITGYVHPPHHSLRSGPLRWVGSSSKSRLLANRDEI